MREITRDDLWERLERGDDLRLVMTMGAWAFDAARIPGSLRVAGPDDAARLLRRDDAIVVYCSDPLCRASREAYRRLVAAGYRDVRIYSGGLADWQAAGLPLEGSGA